MPDQTHVMDEGTRFTPGPWESEGRVVWIDTREQVCCGRGTYECCGIPDVRGGQEQIGEFGTEADATLAAAAPDMYEALKALFSDERFRVSIGGNPNAVESLIAKALAAISKAEGKTPPSA